MSEVFQDKKFGLWKREGMENLSDNEKGGDDEKDGKSVNDATVVCVPKCPEWKCISLFFFPQKPPKNFEHSSTSLRIHCLSICTPGIKCDVS